MSNNLESYDEEVIETSKSLVVIKYLKVTNSTDDFKFSSNYLKLNSTFHHEDSKLMDYLPNF